MDIRFQAPPEGPGVDPATLKHAFLRSLAYTVGKDPEHATGRDWYQAVAGAARDRLVDPWMATTRRYHARGAKRVYYLSLEFLIGRLLTNTLANLGITEASREALGDLGVDLDQLVAEEPDAALGNGGLGRLAACFLDSMANLRLPGFGYGIRYEYGMFKQAFLDGAQVEMPEDWLAITNPWEFPRPEVTWPVDFYGRVERMSDDGPHPRCRWVDTQRVTAMAYDTPIVGWQARAVNTLRLWSAKPVNFFDLEAFNRGDFVRAIEEQAHLGNLSWVLYPADSHLNGQELRLKQEFFFTSASLQDILHRHRHAHGEFDSLPDKAALQLNDTHPALAVPELMRILVDVYGVAGPKAWDLTRATVNYTNHTLLPEALECWSLPLLERVLPRHMQIIYGINADFLQAARRRTGIDDGDVSALSLIDEGGERRVRMGNLAFVGCRRVNGVSALHTDLMKSTVFRHLHGLFPDRIVNMTNGITPRRWLHQCNRPLSTLICEAIGSDWIGDLERIEALEPLARDAGFRAEFAAAKHRNKVALSALIRDVLDMSVDPAALFDVQIKRIHEYKRQLLNILHAVALYNDIRDHPGRDTAPRVKIFGGKAAPSYVMAKLIIRLANDVARVINLDPSVRDRLKICVLPNYNVTWAEKIIPAADLSEQISTAGMEASGTGNMKFALNGALTVGTLDGANIEIKDRVGADNIYMFGMDADQIAASRHDGFDPAAAITGNAPLRRAIDMIGNGAFSPDEPERYRGIVEGLYDHDYFRVVGDFAAYDRIQGRIGEDFTDADAWTRRAILNTARVGWFSSDRTITDYAATIWGAAPVLD